MSPEEEAAIRADERLKVLRKVRKVAYEMDRNPANDPYLWGYGGREICRMLSGMYRQQQDFVGGAAPIAEARRDTELRTLRKVHQRAKLIEDDWACDGGTGAYDVIRMIEELIRQAEADPGIPDQG